MIRFASAALAATLLLAPAQAQDAFPVTIEHALGSTTIEAKPQRVVTWGWSAQDVVIDLGVTPVGMPFFAYGGGDDGILPWTEAALAEHGMDMPVVLPNGTEPPIEAIAALRPDLILAPYSGLTPDEYATLSNIAPVVAYPEKPWFISWQDVVRLTGTALGETEKAEQLVADTQAWLAVETAPYPEMQGMVFANFINRNDGQVSVRNAGDPRVELFADLGMVPAGKPDVATGEPDAFYYYLSYENFDRIPAEVLVSFFDNEQAAADFFAMDLIQLSPLVAKGAYTRLVGEELTMSVSGAVTPLSLRWGFPEVATELGRAVKAASSD
ncbi:ABC transporter substrate-binding protein [Devosia chinhatensis]|nr:ABC transporter substrate-binding protein [Devosia chinhatensis]